MKLEIELRTDCWVEVDRLVFRSWCGRRRINGKRYIGKRYNFMTKNLISKDQKTAD